MNYRPFEKAIGAFYATAPNCARPFHIKVGAPELRSFTAWVDRLSGAHRFALDETTPAVYDGLAVECVSAESYPPSVE
jgi:hypothetical protein